MDLVVSDRFLDKDCVKCVTKEAVFFVGRLDRIQFMEGVVFHIWKEMYMHQVDRYRLRRIGKGLREMNGLIGPGLEPRI